MLAIKFTVGAKKKKKSYMSNNILFIKEIQISTKNQVELFPLE